MSDKRFRDEWNLRYGFNHPENPPPYYGGQNISVRKVEISDAYDLKPLVVEGDRWHSRDDLAGRL